MFEINEIYLYYPSVKKEKAPKVSEFELSEIETPISSALTQ